MGSKCNYIFVCNAYDDFATVLEALRNVIYQAEQIEGWEKSVQKFKNDLDFDREDILDSIKYHEGEMEESLEKLRIFVEERNKEGWDIKR